MRWVRKDGVAYFEEVHYPSEAQGMTSFEDGVKSLMNMFHHKEEAHDNVDGERRMARVAKVTPWARSVQMDILSQVPESVLAYICKSVGISREQVLFVYAGVPCETFSRASILNSHQPTRDNPSGDPATSKSGHGCSYRKPPSQDRFRSPCCEQGIECKYCKIAHLHDQFVPHLQQMFVHDYASGLQYHFGIENPDGMLQARDYMQIEQWPTACEPRYCKFDSCAYDHPLGIMKPMSFWTNLADYVPRGTTGHGRCLRQCDVGHVTEKGGYEHPGRVRDMKSRKLKNALAPDWVREVLTSAIAARKSKSQTVVVDLFAGWQSLAPICEEFGLNYVGVDIEGNRNLAKGS